jgi:hypothetical protein
LQIFKDIHSNKNEKKGQRTKNHNALYKQYERLTIEILMTIKNIYNESAITFITLVMPNSRVSHKESS